MKTKLREINIPDIPDATELSVGQLNSYKLDVRHSVIVPGMLKKQAIQSV